MSGKERKTERSKFGKSNNIDNEERLTLATLLQILGGREREIGLSQHKEREEIPMYRERERERQSTKMKGQQREATNVDR